MFRRSSYARRNLGCGNFGRGFALATRLTAMLSLLVLMRSPAVAQTFDIDRYYLSTHRMGSFQCLQCPRGGFLEGVRETDQTRILRHFSAIQRLCVSKYAY